MHSVVLSHLWPWWYQPSGSSLLQVTSSLVFIGTVPASSFGDLIRGSFSSCFWLAGQSWFTSSLWDWQAQRPVSVPVSLTVSNCVCFPSKLSHVVASNTTLFHMGQDESWEFGKWGGSGQLQKPTAMWISGRNQKPTALEKVCRKQLCYPIIWA